MREIKFRGKRKDNGEWVYGGYFIQRNINVDFKVYNTHFILLNTEKALDFRWMIEVDPKTVSQFIGFTDKNGRDIYGRDLVEDENGIGEVEWVQEHCAYLVFTRNPSQYHRLESDGKLSRTAVIGNAIDNPELLEV